MLRLNNWRRRVFAPACRLAGLEGVRPHDLRHTAASMAIAAGANVKAVQRMLGHASAAMTLDVYAGLFADDLDSVAMALDARVPHQRPPAARPTLPNLPRHQRLLADLRQLWRRRRASRRYAQGERSSPEVGLPLRRRASPRDHRPGWRSHHHIGRAGHHRVLDPHG